MANIGRQIDIPGRFHVALIEREGGGAVLLPVVCWCVVDGAIVPFYVDLRTDGITDSLTIGDADDTDFLGIVPPGEEVNGPWNDIANQRIESERQDGDLEQRRKNATRLLTEIAGTPELEMLRKKPFLDRQAFNVHSLTPEDTRSMFMLASHDLVIAHPHGTRDLCMTWLVSMLGEEVLRQDAAAARSQTGLANGDEEESP